MYTCENHKFYYNELWGSKQLHMKLHLKFNKIIDYVYILTQLGIICPQRKKYFKLMVVFEGAEKWD